MSPMKSPPSIGINGNRNGYVWGGIPASENPLTEKIDSKNSIIQRKKVDAKPARNPSKAARINIFWSNIKILRNLSLNWSVIVDMELSFRNYLNETLLYVMKILMARFSIALKL